MLDTTLTPAADEDRWEVPAQWWELAVPTRGLGPRGPLAPVTTESLDHADSLAVHRVRVDELIERTAVGAVDLAEAARAAIADPTTCSPLGTAALSRAVELVVGQFPQNRGYFQADATAAATVESWVRERGVGFAVEAAVLRMGLNETQRYSQDAKEFHFTLCRRAIGDIGVSEFVPGLIRLRAHLAEVPEDEYRAVMERLGELRTAPGGMAIRVAASFLAPTEQDWVTADLAAAQPGGQGHNPFALLAASVGTRADLETLVGVVGGQQLIDGYGTSLLHSALTRLGPECGGVLTRLVRRRDLDNENVIMVAGMLSRIPTDEAFAALVSRIEQRFVPQALMVAAQRFPHRAARMLRPLADRSGTARHILRSVALTHAGVIAELTEWLPSSSRPTATESELPDLLREVPWQRAHKQVKPVVISGISAANPPRLAWAAGERENWQLVYVRSRGLERDWAGSLAKVLSETLFQDHDVARIIAVGPEDLVRPLLTRQPGVLWNPEFLQRILARFGEDGLDFAVQAVQGNPTHLAEVLAPISGTAVTQLVTPWLESKKRRSLALTWFDRHLESAVPDLIAAALGKAGKNRRLAESALRLLSARGHRGTIDTAATAFGNKVTAAVRDLLDADPLMQLPNRIPAIPNWLVPELLPSIVLRDSGAVLPVSTLPDVCTAFALCGPNGDYAGVAHLAEATEPGSLAEFAWGVFEQWRIADHPAQDGWVLHAQGLVGDDETARRLGPLIRMWPGQSNNARAVAGLDVLTAIGSDVALMQLHGIAETVKFKALKTKAREKVAEIAESLGLTPEELADRLVPDFGLNDTGTLVLDYGPRGFVIGFDEQLAPAVFDAVRDGDTWQPTSARKSLPKPTDKDDPELAPAAYKAFATLKKEVKIAAADQIRRLEQAMVRSRRWTAAEHRSLFVDHPLLRHLTRRLVWATFDANGTVTGSFHIAEDRTYADNTDAPLTLADDTTVGIAHPLQLSETLTAWGELFADYELLQPFPQLHRDTHAFTDQERTTSVLARFQDATVPTGKVVHLLRNGWERGEIFDGTIWAEPFRELGTGQSVVLGLKPGVIAGNALEWPEQRITVRITETGSEEYPAHRERGPFFADLDPITASELLREIHALTA